MAAGGGNRRRWAHLFRDRSDSFRHLGQVPATRPGVNQMIAAIVIAVIGLVLAVAMIAYGVHQSTEGVGQMISPKTARFISVLTRTHEVSDDLGHRLRVAAYKGQMTPAQATITIAALTALPAR